MPAVPSPGIFPPFHGLLFTSLCCQSPSMQERKALILLKFNVPVSAFAARAFGVTASKSSPNSVLWRFCLFSSMNF